MRNPFSLALTSFAIAILATTQVLGYQGAIRGAAPTKPMGNVEQAVPIPSPSLKGSGTTSTMPGNAVQQPAQAPATTMPAAKPAAQSNEMMPSVGGNGAKATTGFLSQPTQTPAAAMMPAAKPAAQSNGKIRFTFTEQDWSDVIPWFAEQANFSLQPIADFPEGVFTLKDDSEYTVLEALDQLNHALRIRKPEPYTLIRNRNMLVLWKLEDANFPNDLIETVKVEDLDKRGKYETLSCIFDLGELDAEEVSDEAQQLVTDSHNDFFAVFPAANQIHVRETGGQLRKIRDLINDALKREYGDQMRLKVYNLKNLDAESFMGLARGLLGMDEKSNKRNDEKLLISVEPFAERLFVRGTEKWLGEFDNVAKLIDADSDEVVEGVVLDAPKLKMYKVLIDPKLAFDTLQTMLESRDEVRMQQDEASGSIVVLGREDDHNLVANTLAALSGESGDGFAMIQLLKGDPAEIILVLRNLFGQSATAEKTTGPVLLANSLTNQIYVRGTPQEVETVKGMVAELDANSHVADTGPRTQTRIIPMGAREMEELAPLLPDLLMSAGRKNPFNLIMPKERKDVQGSIKKQQSDSSESVDDFLRGLSAPDQKPAQGTRPAPRRLDTSELKTKASQIMAVAAHVAGLNLPLASGLIMVQETEEPSAVQRPSTYQPAAEVKSVPGAPIVGRFVNGSLILDSEDLDALDDLVYEIESRVGNSSEVQRPTFFFLEHRKADQMMGFLTNYYNISGGGTSESSGGGLMEGMMSNMMGGGSDLFGGLLGGSSGSGSGEFLQGDVRFGVDLAFNSLWVAGATEIDLEEISILIDTLDQPEAPHDPKLLGEFRTIDIIHRDPMEVKEIIEPMLGDLLESKMPSGEGNGGDQAQLVEMVQQLSGGKKNGGAVTLDKKPKVRLGIDMKTRQLLVSGPEFIYKDILRMVIELDKPELSAAPEIETMTNVNNQDAVVRALQQMFGAKIVVVGEEAASASGGGGQSNGSSTSNEAGQSDNDAAEARSALIEAMRNQARRNNRGGGNRGGGNRGGGGGNRGGGGRGR